MSNIEGLACVTSTFKIPCSIFFKTSKFDIPCSVFDILFFKIHRSTFSIHRSSLTEVNLRIIANIEAAFDASNGRIVADDGLVQNDFFEV